MTIDSNSLDRRELDRWLVTQGLAGMPVAEIYDGLCRSLTASGIPLARGYLSFATLHPLQWATGIIWQGGRVTESVELAHGFESRPSWIESPFRRMLEQRLPRLHRRLVGPDAQLDFPVLQEFRNEGLTDWLALVHLFGWSLDHNQVDELGVISSWATDSPEGWSAESLAVIDEFAATLALAVKASSGRDTTKQLLATYLGREAADRVVAGQIRRGSVEKTVAIVLYADIRAFTDFAEVTPAEEVTRRLNDCFDAMGEPVRNAGGEILKFLGDGFLAMFRPAAGSDMATVAAAALGAARDALARIMNLGEAERRAGNAPLAVDIALHAGEVSYGNVGTADRLDFTVIGPAVNQVARLEGLCRDLGRNLVISDSFASAAPALRPQLRSLGFHALRGVAGPREVFAGDNVPE